MFSTFLPTVAANYDVGGFSLGVGGEPIRLGRVPRDSLSSLAWAPAGWPQLGTTFELAELKVQWLLLDFGRRLGRYEQARLASDVAGSRPIAPTKRWPTRSRSPTTTSSGARRCGGPPRMPFVAPTRNSRTLASASARASSSARPSCGPRSRGRRSVSSSTPPRRRSSSPWRG